MSVMSTQTVWGKNKKGKKISIDGDVTLGITYYYYNLQCYASYTSTDNTHNILLEIR